MADNKKAVCGGFLVGDGLEFEGKTLYATSTGGTEDYTELENKPSINNVELNGNKTLEDLGIASKDDLDEAVTTLEDAIDNIVDDIESVDTTLQQHSDKIAANSSRIDTFTHLPEGSTTGDAELADIRVGYNGETYSSAGSAVREQVSGLKQDLEDVETDIDDTYRKSETYSKTEVDNKLDEAGKVKSVNGKTGDVVITSEDIHYSAPKSEIESAVYEWLEDHPIDPIDPKTRTAYEAGAVNEILRNDTAHKSIIPLQNTKTINNSPVNKIPISSGNLMHEMCVTLPNDNILVVAYLENLTGGTEDTAVLDRDIRVRVKTFGYFYGVMGYPTKLYESDPLDVGKIGTVLDDGSVCRGGAGTCQSFTIGSEVYVGFFIYDSNGLARYVVSHADYSVSNNVMVSGYGVKSNATFSAPTPMMLIHDGKTEEWSTNAIKEACGIQTAVWQSNNQVWNESNRLYMAVSLKHEGVMVVTSTDGINWTFRGFYTTNYKPRFAYECSCAFRSDRLLVACRNDNVANTVSADKNFTNCLTILKINTVTWNKVDEYNIPDCGCKPYFLPGRCSVTNSTGDVVKSLLLLHNPYTRDRASILALGDYPMFYLGDIEGGANYITGATRLSAGNIQYIAFVGTNGLVKNKQGGILSVGINVSKIANIPQVIADYLSFGENPVTDDHINSLIDVKLGVIENGSY